MQPAGVPFTPHCTSPRSLTTPGANWFVAVLNVTALPAQGAIDENNSAPEHGSTANLVGLNLAASQFQAFSFFSLYVPNRLTRNPQLTVSRRVTFQSSWKY